MKVASDHSEIEKLKEGQKRELRIELNGERNLTESISLEYLKPTTIAPNNPPINGSPLHFSIYAAEGSDLPPILNAVEGFVFVELPLSPTNINDGIFLLFRWNLSSSKLTGEIATSLSNLEAITIL
ncbi:hypothetical protein Patl1_33934 [Pistacia atlantica]|uniref:Uncharacterized protein n=1 Tax=Pistacia atlantica TaxID=434234 RepID=A0ACC0ZWK5_9ROSI|nr:hypothetical protein Patl1_33934 [Pistacia atlantica]